MGLFYFAIGIRGVVQKKPFLIPYRWMIGVVFVCFLPSIFNAFFFRYGQSFDVIRLLNPLMIVCLFAFMIIFRPGYIAFGITDSAIREALHSVLKKKNLPFEETIGSIKLTSLQAELQVSIQGWTGTGQIRVRPFNQSKLLTEIVDDINIYFQENDTKTNLTACIFYIVMAVFMLVSSFCFYSLGASVKANINNEIAWKYAEENRNLDQALTLVDKAIAYKPDWHYLDTKAEIFYKMRRYQEAVSIESDLVNRYPDEQILQEQLKKFNKGLNTASQVQQ
jgi:tetratricopeptide (TPR) repeat protein